MSNILAGLFEHHSDYKKLEADLENSGFQSSDYIVYLNDAVDHHSKYLVSVAVKDSTQTNLAKDVFAQHTVHKTYLFENMSIEQTDYAHLKGYIDARNKAEIHNSPGVRIKASSTGIDSEVKF